MRAFLRGGVSLALGGLATLALARPAPGLAAAPAHREKAADKSEPAEARPVPFDRRWLEPYFVGGALGEAAEAFRREEWRRAVTAFTAALKRVPKNAPERAPARYLLALATMNANDWDDAAALFQDLYQRYPLLAAYHAHDAARCHLRAGNPESALTWSEKVPEGSILEAETALIRLDAFEALGRWADIDKEAKRFLERFPNGPRRSEAMFHRAVALEELKAPAPEIAAIYHRIWAEAPLEGWARKSEERLAALVARQPRAPGKAAAGQDPAELARMTAAEWLQRGLVLFDRNQNEDSEAAFTTALGLSPAGPGSQDLRCKAEFHRAQSIFKQRQRARAAPFFTRAEAACREAGDGDLTTKALYQGGRCLLAAGDREGALAKFALIEKEAPRHSYADDARLRAAEIHTDDEQAEDAAKLLSTLPDLYPQGDQAGEAMWRLALAAIQEKNWVEANRWLDENLQRIPREDIWYAEGRALYWKARVALAQGTREGKTQALALYTRAVHEYPLSVYTFLAFERMRTEFPEARRKLVRELRAELRGANSKAAWHFAPRAVFARPEFKRAVELARLGLGGDARRELARMGLSGADSRDSAREADKQADKAKRPGGSGKAGAPADEGRPSSEREDVTWITAILLDRGRSWAAAHAIPRYSLTDYRTGYPEGKREAIWRLSYPRAFPELVGPASRVNHVPEALQLAIMREESAFNPRIESFANALGLTQMLVKTARQYSDRPVNRETLLDPARNVEVGSRFLSSLLKRYRNREPLAISGYNAGEGAVDRWLAERGDLALDEFMETIPYDETRNYTKRVLASYLTYSWLYDSAKPIPELSFSVKITPLRPEHGRPAGRHGPRRHQR